MIARHFCILLTLAPASCNADFPSGNQAVRTGTSLDGSANIRNSQERMANQMSEAGKPDVGSDRLRRLNGTELRASIAGFGIRPDPSHSQAHIGFSEDFHPDGSWKTIRSERGVKVMTGKWRTNGEELCVVAQGRPEVCREVWIDLLSGKLVLRDAGSSVHKRLVMLRSPLN